MRSKHTEAYIARTEVKWFVKVLTQLDLNVKREKFMCLRIGQFFIKVDN